MSADDEIIVRLTAQTDQLNAGMAEAASTVQTSTDAMAASFSNATASYAAFDAIQKTNLATAAQVAEAQRTINEVQATGAFTAEELAAKQTLVDAAMLKVGKETQAASGALSMFTRNSRTMYSTSALITDAMTGQFSRMRREVAALGNETGLMGRAFGFIASPIGIATLAIAGLGVGVIEAQDHYDKFQQTILRTGNIIGMSAGELQTMADDIGAMTGHTFEAVDAVNALGASGRFTGDQLHVAAEAAVDFSTVTGENVGKAAQIIESLQEKPKTAIAEVNDQFHFLTQSQADLIEKLLATGQNAQAAAVAVQAFHDAMADRADEMEQHTSALARDWHDVSGAIQQAAENLAEYIEVATGGGDVSEKLAVAQRQLAHDEEVASHSILYRWGLMHDEAEKYIDKEKEAIALLQKQQSAEDAAAQAKAKNAQATAAQFDKATGKGSKGGSGVSALEQEFQEQEAKAHASYDQIRQDAADFWNAQATDAKNSVAVQAQAWQKYIEARHQLDEQGLAQERETTRKQEENARKAAEAAKQAAQGRARAEQQASQEIIEEANKEAAAKLAADEQATENAHNLATARITASLQGYKQEAATGQISAAEMLRDQIDALNQQLAADLNYYQTKAKLAAGDAAEQAKWNAAAVIDQQKTEAKMAQVARQYQDEINRINAEILRQKERDDQEMIMSGFREINALVGRQETLKQALQNIGMRILEVEEQNIAKSIAAHFAAEQAKTAATVTGNAERVAADQVGQAQSLLVQGEAAVKWIMTEAAKAAAGAFNALVSIPYVGPFLAVGASIAAFAAVSKLVSSVASAEGGWERVPADGVQTELHRDEMVLPKHVADPVRKAATKGFSGGGFGGNVHIHAMDGISVMRVLKKNPAALRAALSHAGRNGWRP